MVHKKCKRTHEISKTTKNLKEQVFTLKITQSEIWDFYAYYDLLTPIQKNIWKCLVWWKERFPTSFPTQSTIAKKCRCGRKHVNRTIAHFKRLGWISLTSRGGRRSKIISIPQGLLSIDLSNRQYFRSIKVTTEGTSIYINRRRNSIGASPSNGRIDIPIFLRKLSISLDSKLKLSLFSEGIFEEARHQCQKIAKTGFKPDNEEHYFVGVASQIAKKRGIKINWLLYYQNRNLYDRF